MNHKFDELTKSLAQSVTRRGALKKFGLGLAVMALACFGLANKASAATYSGYCEAVRSPYYKSNTWFLTGYCYGVDPATGTCRLESSGRCPTGERVGQGKPGPCGGYWKSNLPCSFSV